MIQEDTDPLSNSRWSISETTCSTCSENSEEFIGDSVGKTRVIKTGLFVHCWYQYNSIDAV